MKNILMLFIEGKEIQMCNLYLQESVRNAADVACRSLSRVSVVSSTTPSRISFLHIFVCPLSINELTDTNRDFPAISLAKFIIRDD